MHAGGAAVCAAGGTAAGTGTRACPLTVRAARRRRRQSPVLWPPRRGSRGAPACQRQARAAALATCSPPCASPRPCAGWSSCRRASARPPPCNAYAQSRAAHAMSIVPCLEPRCPGACERGGAWRRVAPPPPQQVDHAPELLDDLLERERVQLRSELGRDGQLAGLRAAQLVEDPAHARAQRAGGPAAAAAPSTSTRAPSRARTQAQLAPVRRLGRLQLRRVVVRVNQLAVRAGDPATPSPRRVELRVPEPALRRRCSSSTSLHCLAAHACVLSSSACVA